MAAVLTVLRAVPYVASSSPGMLFVPPAQIGWHGGMQLMTQQPHPSVFTPMLRRPVSGGAGRGGGGKPMSVLSTVRAEVDGVAKISGRRKVAGTRWLELQQIDYHDESGVPRVWDAVSRPGLPDLCAVAILPILKKKGSQDQIMLISQFRPAVGAYCIEAPAGLLGEGEDLRETAARELLEETGLTVSRFVADDAGDLLNDPGITPTRVKLLVCEVDLDDAANKEASERGHEGVYGLAEEGEYIRRKVVPLAAFRDSLAEFEREGFAVDGKLMCFARGLAFGMEIAAKFAPSSK
eukprot:CAMPEP_0173467336 /NCGR_PEP_ID=MMETSP1357-20121228/74864_1 /TAXON_ID=77926 /ORGANISM="Hemiselmis rufescens, Strain PCC563" /LENGTH=293 /DNA_ID=CAMNT_0014435467 /DNA_START=1 /DNA_END=882 /DNA_ORIENTATION=+